MIRLDTNVVIGLLRRGHAQLRERFEREAMEDTIAVSVVALFKLRFGIAKSVRPDESAAQLEDLPRIPVPVLDFDAEDASEAGRSAPRSKRAAHPLTPTTS